MNTTPWVDGLTFTEVLARTCERFPDQLALSFPRLGYRQDFRAFHSEVELLARALLAIGIERGAHIGIWATNWPQWVQVQFAAARIGAVLVNVNPAYRASELGYVLQQADIDTLILTDEFKTSRYYDLLAEVCPELAQCLPGPSFPRLRQVVSIKDAAPPGILPWSAFRQKAAAISAAALAARQQQVRAEDVVSIQYTSGTTGFPKGAMLTHRNLLLNAFYVGERLHFGPEDRLCVPVPLYHCFGCVLATIMCVVHGSGMVFPAESFDAEAALQAIHQERCTGIYGVPTMFIAELNHDHFSKYDLSSLRTGVMAGSPCPIAVMRDVVDRMHATEMTIAYGLTEASPIITQTDTSDSLEHRVGTVGQAIPGVEVRLVAPGTMNDVPPGEQGELMARGHGIMRGYYNKPVETAQALTPDGWLHSGDLAVRTPDGYYRITGRIKDMIIRGGENVYPREIEEFLFTHPAIADVQIVGLPDPRFGEEICAWIRIRAGATLTEDEVRQFCKGKIAHYKVPRYIVFVAEYPTTVTGKVQKFRLRELGIERFGLQQAARIETA